MTFAISYISTKGHIHPTGLGQDHSTDRNKSGQANQAFRSGQQILVFRTLLPVVVAVRFQSFQSSQPFDRDDRNGRYGTQGHCHFGNNHPIKMLSDLCMMSTRRAHRMQARDFQWT